MLLTKLFLFLTLDSETKLSQIPYQDKKMSLKKKISNFQKEIQEKYNEIDERKKELHKLQDLENKIIRDNDQLGDDIMKIKNKLTFVEKQNEFYQMIKDYLFVEDISNIIFDYCCVEKFSLREGFVEKKIYKFKNYTNTPEYLEINDVINNNWVWTLCLTITYLFPFSEYTHYRLEEVYDLNHILSEKFKEVTDLKSDAIEKYKKAYRVLYSYNKETTCITYLYINKKLIFSPYTSFRP